MQYLYLIKCQQFHKIGIATDVEARLAQLSTGNPFPLEVVVVYKFDNAEIVERAIHQRYKNIRQRGEWFNLSYDDLKDIHNICHLLGGSAFEYRGQTATDDVIQEIEEIQENSVFEYNPETMRTEVRMSNGEPRGVAILTRDTPKRALAYFGKTNSEFEKYLAIYKAEHPDGRSR